MSGTETETETGRARRAGRPFRHLGLKVPQDPAVISEAIERSIRRGRYEAGEILALDRVLRSGDRVLELGAGLGLVSARAAQIVGPANVVAVEANPDLIGYIRRAHALNGVEGVRIVHALAGRGASGPRAFYLRADFWASSLEPHSRPYERMVEVEVLDLARLIAEHRPSVLIADIEGAEDGLFQGLDLAGVRALVMEVHPKVYGHRPVTGIVAELTGQGFEVDPETTAGSIRGFRRPEPRRPAAFGAERGRPWTATPRVLAISCMKNEGPFILEWLAHHRAVGIEDYLIFTNDCDDGTDALLDVLDARGVVRHLPNPAVLAGAPALQPFALAYAAATPAARRADMLLSIDVDEFVAVRVGQGRLADLIARVAPFDALSLASVDFANAGIAEYTRDWITGQFRHHGSLAPGPLKAHRGVKTLVFNGNRLSKLRNHRPDLAAPEGGEAVWLDGSGRPVPAALRDDPTQNGADCRGSMDLAILAHYPLRSRASYVVKSARGDVVVKDKRVGIAYWRRRDHPEAAELDFAPIEAARRAEWQRLLADPAIRCAHEAACAAHEAKIAALRLDPGFAALEAEVASITKPVPAG